MKKFLKIASWLFTLVAFLLIMSFTQQHQNDKRCWNVEISILGENDFHFVDQVMVREIIEPSGSPIIGKFMNEINISQLRKRGASLHAVDKVEVSKTIDGQILVELTQRTPILRVLFQDGSGIYIDQKGYAMPLAPHYTAHVPILTGKVLSSSDNILQNDPFLEKNELLKDAFHLTSVINKHEWLSSQLEHLAVDENGDFIFIPRIGNHKIVVGKAEKLKIKFKKLKAFYEATVGKKDLNKYTDINLKYRDQVVCSKRP